MERRQVGSGGTQREREAALAANALDWYAAASWLLSRAPRVSWRLRRWPARPPSKVRKDWLKDLRALLVKLEKGRTSRAFQYAIREMIKRADQLLWQLVSAWSDMAWVKINQGTGSDAPKADIHQHVMINLHEAAVRWDPTTSRFSSWAGWYIRMAINDPEPRDNLVHVPGQERWLAHRAARAVYRQGATLAEAAASLGTTTHQLQSISRAMNPPTRTSTVQPLGGYPTATQERWAAQGEPWDRDAEPVDAEHIEESLDRARLWAIVRIEVDHLPSKAAPVVCWFYGIKHPVHNPKGERLAYAQIIDRQAYTSSWIQAILTKSRRMLRVRLAFRMDTLQAVSWFVAGEHSDKIHAWAHKTVDALASGDVEAHHVESALKALFRLGYAVPMPPGGHLQGYCKAKPSATQSQSQPTMGSTTTASKPQVMSTQDASIDSAAG